MHCLNLANLWGEDITNLTFHILVKKIGFLLNYHLQLYLIYGHNI